MCYSENKKYVWVLLYRKTSVGRNRQTATATGNRHGHGHRQHTSGQSILLVLPAPAAPAPAPAAQNVFASLETHNYTDGKGIYISIYLSVQHEYCWLNCWYAFSHALQIRQFSADLPAGPCACTWDGMGHQILCWPIECTRTNIIILFFLRTMDGVCNGNIGEQSWDSHMHTQTITLNEGGLVLVFVVWRCGRTRSRYLH